MKNAEKKAAKSSRWAEKELVIAREWAGSNNPNAGPEAREMARAAKRRKRKATRRAAKAACRDYEHTP